VEEAKGALEVVSVVVVDTPLAVVVVDLEVDVALLTGWVTNKR